MRRWVQPSHGGNVALTVALIPLVLWLDARTTFASQLALAVICAAALWWMLKVLPREDRARVWGCVLVSALGETFCTQVWGAYAYRLGNVPTYVILGHGMLCAMALSGGRLLAVRSRVIVIGVALIASAWAIAGLVLPSRPDVEGALFLPLFLPLLARSPRRLEHALTFLAASFVELVGTGVHTWEWSPTLPWLLIPAGNPPSVVAGGYCYFAVLGGLVVTTLTSRGSEAVANARESAHEEAGALRTEGAIRGAAADD